MTRLLEILISMAIVAVLFLLVGVVLPSSKSLRESVETNRRMTIVYDTLNSLRRFKDWSPLTARDPGIQLKVSGPESGVGARVDFTSQNSNIGTGSWELTESVPNEKISYAITDEQRGSNKRTDFLLKPTGRNNRNVEITQTYHVDYGWDLIGRYAGLYVSRSVGDNLKLGLGRIMNMLAAVPNVDYRVEGSRLTDLQAVDTPAEHLLVVAAGGIERNNQKIQDSMKANLEWIKRNIDANGLQAVGPVRIITTELGRETYTFDVAQAVVRRGAGASANGDDDDDAAGAPAAPVPATGSESPLTGLALTGPVTYVHRPAGRAAKASYVGYMAELDNVRNALRAWAVTAGHEVTERPYEAYRNGVDAAFTESGEYDVFWTLRDPNAQPVAAAPVAPAPAAPPADGGSR